MFSTGWVLVNLYQNWKINSSVYPSQEKKDQSNNDGINNIFDVIKVATKKSGPSGIINIVFSCLIVLISIYAMRELAKVSTWYQAISIILVVFIVIWCLHMNYKFSKILEHLRSQEKRKQKGS